MDTIESGPRGTTGVAHAPSVAVLWAVVVAGLAAAACTILLALTSDHIPEPGVHAGLRSGESSASSSPASSLGGGDRRAGSGS